MLLGLSMNKQTFELLLPVCLWNILNTCITRCMYLPSQKRNMIRKPVYCCATKCKTEFGNWDKAYAGWPGWREKASVRPSEVTVSVIEFDILPYNWLHCKNLGLDLSLTTCEPMSVREMGVCAFWVTPVGEKDVIWEKQSVIFYYTELPFTNLLTGLYSVLSNCFWATTSGNLDRLMCL